MYSDFWILQIWGNCRAGRLLTGFSEPEIILVLVHEFNLFRTRGRMILIHWHFFIYLYTFGGTMPTWWASFYLLRMAHHYFFVEDHGIFMTSHYHDGRKHIPFLGFGMVEGKGNANRATWKGALILWSFFISIPKPVAELRSPSIHSTRVRDHA